MRYFFTPAMNAGDILIIQHYGYCFFNPAGWYPKPDKLPIRIGFVCLSDSGGYQLYSRNKDYENGNGSRRCIVIPGVGIKTRKNCLIIDPIDLCRKYGELGIDYGFTLDYPLSDNASEEEYEINLLKSYEWAKLMIGLRDDLCPTTKLLIPLHYCTEQQLRHYFNTMSKLNPDGYAIPVRDTSTWEDMVRIAYALCFLQHKRVKIVHMFGSSRREIIILGAAASGLGMFQQLSFDSTSWNTAIYVLQYLDSKTLGLHPVHDIKKVKLNLPESLIEELQSTVIDPALKKKLILLHNVIATSDHANAMLKRAKDIETLKRFIENTPHLSIQRRRLLASIGILHTSMKRGFPYIEKWFGWIWN